ncbi:uncharacterized protein LOC133367137 isoform X2 [Rhineura floridana]|nr:uncharacterized protein LOC133367137 isoform X2 [Rhineura floridana]XP_061446938.1 uncharacterized protein LOC133367137 isoform X2 [Rhineura floridana]
MKNTTKSPCHLGVAALHDHNAYCMPEEATALKSLVRELQDMVHCQSECLLRLQGAVEASQRECGELKEKAYVENWILLPNLRERFSQLKEENQNLHWERDQLEAAGQRLWKELDASGATVLSLSRQLRGQHEAEAHHGAFSLESVQGNAKWLRFYTGVDKYPRLTAFLDFLLDGNGEERSPESGPHSALSPNNQLFLVLVRLRLGLLLQDLAFRFHISESTASRYWVSWTELMERKLRQPGLKHKCLQIWTRAYMSPSSNFFCPAISSNQNRTKEDLLYAVVPVLKPAIPWNIILTSHSRGQSQQPLSDMAHALLSSFHHLRQVWGTFSQRTAITSGGHMPLLGRARGKSGQSSFMQQAAFYIPPSLSSIQASKRPYQR